MPDIPASIDTERSEPARTVPAVNGLFVAVVIVGMLYFGREVFVPAVLAVLLGFVLAPLVRLLQRFWVPRALAVLTVVLLAFVVIFALGTLVATQVSDLAAGLPRYQSTMVDKIRSLRGATEGSGVMERLADVLQHLGAELNGKEGGAAPAGTDGVTALPTPVPVQIHEANPTALATLAAVIDPLLHPLATTGIIIVFVIFILAQREDLRNRLIRLAGSDDLQKTTAAIDDAAQRLSRLFLTQVALNSCFGVVIGLGLWAIGIPSPVLWGILAAVLRFVPYIGAPIAAAFPLILAAAIDPGWSSFIWTAALFATVEPIVGHGIEPLLYGHSTGLSPVAVVAAATFWTWLWGPIGLLLATPLTVCLVVLGRYVKPLEFLDIALGDRPALSPSELFYQRMLVGDPTEAIEKAEIFLKKRSLVSYYDEVALEGLDHANQDAARGVLEEGRLARIRHSVEELIDELADHDDEPEAAPVQDAEAEAALDDTKPVDQGRDLPVLARDALLPDWRGEDPVMCIAGRGPVDDLATRLLAELIERHGVGVRTIDAEALSAANLPRLETQGVQLVCLSALNPPALISVRTAVKRMRRKLPDARIVVGVWRFDDRSRLDDVLASGADEVVVTLEEALETCLNAARGIEPLPPQADARVVTAMPIAPRRTNGPAKRSGER